MDNIITLKIELPQEFLVKLETLIVQTVTKTLNEHIRKIKEQPKMLTRKEAAHALRISEVTLRSYELRGTLIPKRAGRRVLFTQEAIDEFISRRR
jgi:hypothetical protein